MRRRVGGDCCAGRGSARGSLGGSARRLCPPSLRNGSFWIESKHGTFIVDALADLGKDEWEAVISVEISEKETGAGIAKNLMIILKRPIK